MKQQTVIAMVFLAFFVSSIRGQTIISPQPYATITGIQGINKGVGSGSFRVGDFNGDGFPDIVTHSSTRPSAGEAYRGCLLIYFSDVTGQLSPTPNARLFNPGAPQGTLADPFANGFGRSYDAGDVNGDGFDDVIVSADREWGFTATGDTMTKVGAVYIYYGASNLNGDYLTADVRIPHPEFDRPGRYTDPNPTLWFGWTVQTGDFNGDGIGDFVVSEHGGVHAYILHDPAEAIDTVHALPDTVDNYSNRYVYLGPVTGNRPPDHVLGCYWHNQQASSYGGTTADFNGDGYTDYLVSNYGAYDVNVLGSNPTAADSANFERLEQYGKLTIFLGGSDLSSWETFPDIVISKHDINRGDLSRGTELNGYLFNITSSMTQGDYNGDGITDFLSSNIWPRNIFGYEPGLPLKWVYWGGTGLTPGSQPVAAGTMGSTIDASTGTFRAAYAGSPGDINGDGYDDYLASSHLDSTGVDPVTGTKLTGEYYVFLGGPTVTDEPAALLRRPDTVPSNFGLFTGQPLWDMNGDGFNEWAVTATSWGDSLEGRIFIYPGGITITSIDDDPLNILKDFRLEQNYPNPFNPETSISYSVPVPSKVELMVYNLLGQEVVTLVSGQQPAGKHTVIWDGRNSSGRSVASGVYLYRLKAGDFVQTRKMLFVR